MSYIQEFEFEFHVGDVFDVTPLEGSYVIGKILALGGECYLDGNKIVVSSLPNQTAPAPAPVAVEPTPKPDPEEGPIVPVIVHVTPDELEKIEYVPNVVEEAIAASYEFVEDVLDAVQAELEPPLEEEAPPVVKAAPIKSPRKPKVVVKEEIE